MTRKVLAHACTRIFAWNSRSPAHEKLCADGILIITWEKESVTIVNIRKAETLVVRGKYSLSTFVDPSVCTCTGAFALQCSSWLDHMWRVADGPAVGKLVWPTCASHQCFIVPKTSQTAEAFDIWDLQEFAWWICHWLWNIQVEYLHRCRCCTYLICLFMLNSSLLCMIMWYNSVLWHRPAYSITLGVLPVGLKEQSLTFVQVGPKKSLH